MADLNEAMAQAQPAALSRDQLVARELNRTDRDLFGIALSGGGIRSATFNLGLLQGLRKTDLLNRVDYVSTVSGGGYIGGFWTAWRHNRQKGPAAAVVESDGGFPEPPAGGVEDPAIRHLRRFSNFLSPRLGLFSYDTGRLAVAGLTAAIPTVLATLALLLLVVVAWHGALRAFLVGPAAWVPMLIVMTVAAFAVFEAAWRKRERRGADPRYVVFAAGATVLAPVAFGLLELPSALIAWRPVAAWGAVFVTFALLRMLASRHTNSFRRVDVRASLDRVLSRLLFLAAAWSIAVGLWLLAGMLYARMRDGGGIMTLYPLVTAVLTTVFVWSRRMGADEPSKPFGSAIAARLKPRIPQLLAYGVVILVTLGVMVAYAALLGAGSALWWATAAAALVTVLTLLFFHPNRVGLHSFYRGRLARAYLGASNPTARTRGLFTEEAAGDDIPLHEIAGGDGAAPVHLVCCAVNDLAPVDPLANMQRGAASAVLSPFGLGVTETHGSGESAPGLHWSAWRGSSPTLGAAITASGAAFNSMMGSFSKRLGPAATFVLAMLNLRLGVWLRHPREFNRVHGSDAHGQGSTREWSLPGLRFYKELFGLSSADGRDVHLSDGGHFENTAVYELIRRECRYIIACDCGADPDRAYDDVANLIRRVRQDFGVEIRIDLGPLRLNENGLAQQPMVAGDIHYPGGEIGVLLLFKPTLTGSEPPDIAQYRTRNAAFPNESTGDQFYDEAQWESYRRLGEHAADTAFAFLRRTKRLERLHDRDIVAQVFALARFEWLPRPPDFEERISRFAERAGELDLGITGTLLAGVSFDTGPVPGVGAGVEAPALVAVRKGDVARASAASLRDASSHDALMALRRGILFMEETYYAWNLERTHGEPLSLGVMNCFGRWAAAPMLRTWWPLLKGLHSPPFTGFVERHFGLVGIQPSGPDGAPADVITETLEPDPDGYAAACWAAERASAPPRDCEGARPAYIGYRLHMFVNGTRAYSLQAAMLRACRRDALLWWDAGDFFVPAGLWGIGIGEDFLKRLGEGQVEDGTEHWVCLATPAPGDAGAARAAADRRRMYRAAGFVESVVAPDGRAPAPGADWLVRSAARRYPEPAAPLPEPNA